MALSKLQQIKITTQLTLPLLAAFLAQKGMQLIDTIMMGWIGPEALAAGALGTAIFMTVTMFCRGIISAAGIFIVRARGAAQSDEIKSYLQQSVYLALLLSIPCMLTLWAVPSILIILGQQPAIVIKTKALLYGLVWGVPGFMLFLVYREFISAFSLIRIVMVVTLGSLPLTFMANYLLIYGKLGLPALGITGIGCATALVMWFMFFCLWIYSKKHPNLKPYVTAKRLPLEWRKIIDLLRIGVPSGISAVLDSLMFLAAAMMVGYFGVVALASFQIAMQWVSIAFNVPLALGIITSLQIGHAIGSGDAIQAKRAASVGLAMTLIISVILVMPFFLAPEALVRVFLSTSEPGYQQILATAASFLAVAALFQCFDALQVVTNAILRGYKDTMMPMVYNLGCYLLIGIGGGYYLSFHTTIGAIGVWYGLTLAICSAAILLLWRFFSRLKQEKNTLSETRDENIRRYDGKAT